MHIPRGNNVKRVILMAQVRTRKRGKTFSYIFEAGKQGGKRKAVEKGGYPTKQAAYKAGVAAYTSFLHGNIGIVSESISLADFMTHWLDNVVALNVKASSLQNYKGRFDCHICPHIGEVKVQELTPAMLDKWIHNLQKAGLAYNTISATQALLHNALNYAVYPAQLISSNPAAYIKVPKNAPRNVVKRYIITPEQYAALLAKYPFGSPYHIPLMLLYHTGMRIGEVLGLCWADVDFAAKRINVNRQLTYRNKHGYCITEPKTESSKRYILIDDCLLAELRHWQARQAENEKQRGDCYVYIYREDNGHIIRQSKGLPVPAAERVALVCTDKMGRLLLKEYTARLLAREGLNAHSFRHTHTTILAESGVPAKAIAGRLGHANVTITQNLYTHNTLKMQEEAAAVFAKTLRQSPNADNLQTTGQQARSESNGISENVRAGHEEVHHSHDI